MARLAVDAFPKYWRYHVALGSLSYRAADYAAARKELNEAIRLRGEDGPTVGQKLFLAMTHHQLGDKDEAKRFLTAAGRIPSSREINRCAA